MMQRCTDSWLGRTMQLCLQMQAYVEVSEVLDA